MLVFLVVPTITVVVGAFQESGRFTLLNIRALFTPARSPCLEERRALRDQPVVGAVLGGFLAYLVVLRPATSTFRRVVTAISGVLAQFGGVTLAFAFIATLGFSGVITQAVENTIGINLFGSGWLYGLPGLILVYTYFQIPLMVIVFLPALDGIRPQWREAAVNLGASTRQYWTQVAGPMLLPGFLGAAAAAVRERVRRLRHGGRPGQPGQPDPAAVDPRRPHQRGRCWAGRTSPSRWRSRW